MVEKQVENVTKEIDSKIQIRKEIYQKDYI